MKNYYVIPCFISAAAVWAAGGAFAQQCTQAPSCAELGFTDSVSDCADDGILYCPFDKSKVFCRKVNTIPETPDTGTQCQEQGYQLIQDGLSRLFCMDGQTLEYCPADNKYGKCVGELDCEALGFIKNPTCSAGQVKLYCLYDRSYAKCTSGGSSTDGCTVGFATLSSANCKSCPNGVKPNGYFSTNGKACYSCCEASSSGIATCYQCNSVNDDLINDDLMNDGLFNSDIMK